MRAAAAQGPALLVALLTALAAAPWGRAISTDLLVDVEAGAVVYRFTAYPGGC